MITITATPNMAIRLGRVGENERMRVAFDVSAFQTELPGASFAIINQGPGDSAAYPCPGVTVEDGTLYWPITSAELQQTGRGRCELIVTVGDVVAKSVIYSTQILEALDGSGETPSEWETWQTEFAGMVAEAQEAAAEATHEAESAAQSATEALASAQASTDASGAAVAARDSAITASQAAASAQSRAETAAESAEIYAGTASNKAQEATQSASTAASSATAAGVAQGAAETAQGRAEAAADESEDYRDEVVAATEGIAQQTTAQRIAAEVDSISANVEELVRINRFIRWYDELPAEGAEGYTYITPDGVFHYHGGEFIQVSGGGNLNGFGLALDAENRVVLSYANPEDDTDTAEAIMPADSTGAAIIAELQSINASLHEMIPTGEQEG